MKKFFLVVLILLTCIHGQEAKVSMEFPGVTLDVFLKWFANFTNKRIIYGNINSNAKQKKIHLISPKPVPESAVEKICMSVLESNGLTLVRVGRGSSEVYKLVEASNASSKPIALYSVNDLEQMGDGDYYVSQLFVIKHLKASHIINSIRQAKLLDPKSGSIVEIKGANSIIISDFLPNVKRIVKIINMLDKAPPKIKMEFVTLRYANANDISQKINQLMQNRARELVDYNVPEGAISIIPDARTNSLTIRGTSSDIVEIKKLIVKFDRNIREKRIIAKLYRLRHITPDKIVPMLREFITTPLFKKKSAQGIHSHHGPEISVIPNDYNKTLLITAPISAHRILKKVIQRMDVRRPQVMIRAIICEFTPTDVLNLGIELMAIDTFTSSNGFQPQALTSFGLSSVVDEVGNPISVENPRPIAGRAVAPGAGLAAFLTKNETNIPILIRALRSVTHTEVLNVPQIITDDGERAEIRVEQEEPVTSIDALNTSTTSTSFKEFVAAGTVLIIKPHIIRDRWLKLEIEQNVDAFLGAAPAVGIPPPKSSRSIKTTVTVPNNRTIILGGLNGRREIESVDKIPVLGDIPLLGLLFQSKTKAVTKTNLYIFITPIILNDPDFEDLENISKKEYHNMKNMKKKKRKKR